MASLRCLWLGGLLALPATAQLLGPQCAPHFELRVEPASPATQVVAGYLQAGRNTSQAAAIGHRYFFDEAAHTYYGYDVVIEPERVADQYNVLYYDLSIGPLDFVESPAGGLDPKLWKKLPLAALPAPHIVRVNEALENLVMTDRSTGQRLIDSMYLMEGERPPSRSNMQQPIQFRANASGPKRVAYRGPGVRAPEAITVPTVSGTAREFSAGDAEMYLEEPRITINDLMQEFTSPLRQVRSSLVWFYVPGHGRYVLSLLPRRELGFVKAGEVRGGTASFTVGAERVKLESPTALAPGNAPYFLYVLYDSGWTPTSQALNDSLLVGSVSPGELAALTRK